MSSINTPARRAGGLLLVAVLAFAALQDLTVLHVGGSLTVVIVGCVLVVTGWGGSLVRPHPGWRIAQAAACLLLTYGRAPTVAQLALAITLIGLAQVLPLVPAIVAGAATITAMEAISFWRLGPQPLTAIAFTYVGFGALFAFTVVLGSLREEQARTRAALEELEKTREAQVEAARSGERMRLAREMHDVLGHTLSALAVQLESTRLLLQARQAEPEAIEAVSRAHHLAADGLGEARRAVGALRGDDLPGPDLIPQLVAELREQSDAEVTFTVEGTPTQLAPEARLAVFRAAQEALTNVRRHADASQVSVCLVYEPGGVRLTVVNDGVDDSEDGRAGYGLTGMRERADLLGGQLTVGQDDGTFQVELWVPKEGE